MKLGDKVKVKAILKKNVKYFSLDEFKSSKEESFYELQNLYSYKDHYELIEECEDKTKGVYERRIVNKVGILVGKRRVALERTYTCQFDPRWPDGPEEERIETRTKEGIVYLVALNMNHIAKVFKEDIEISTEL